MNEVLLLLTVVYGVVYGVRNLTLKMILTLKDKTVNQSVVGKILDNLFIISILYLYFLVDVVKLVENLKG